MTLASMGETHMYGTPEPPSPKDTGFPKAVPSNPSCVEIVDIVPQVIELIIHRAYFACWVGSGSPADADVRARATRSFCIRVQMTPIRRVGPERHVVGGSSTSVGRLVGAPGVFLFKCEIHCIYQRYDALRI